MILLFEENEIQFQNIGLGILKDATSCIVEEKLNDLFELEMMYPLTGAYFNELKVNRIICVKSNPYSEIQPFRIYSISKPIKGIITVKACHISYDMNYITVHPISGTTPKDVLDKIQNGAILSHNFKLYTDLTGTKSFKTNNYFNMRALLMGSDQSVLEVYKGELLFDKFNVYILSQRGKNKGASVRYAKNMQDVTHEINHDNLYNGVYPFYHKETTEVVSETSSDGFKQVYIVGGKPFQDGWLSYTADGEPYHPIDEAPVQIASEGDYFGKVYCWNTQTQRFTEKAYDQMVNIIDCVTGAVGLTEQPEWIYIDVSHIPNITIKANKEGYFKLSTETEYTYHKKDDTIYSGSITSMAQSLLMFYAEVIPSESISETTESTNVTHIELPNKILWLETDAAKSMKFNKILSLDLTSEFDEAPSIEDLETKAKEYIEKNKIGQYKYETRVSFIDLSSTTEGDKYEKMETIELGDIVKVVYENLGIDVELRVITTKYNVLLNRYDQIELGEKSEKISASSVQSGDNVSSLSNDVGYTDVTTVNKLIAKMITADYIQAKNASLTKAQIEQLSVARINISGMIEATQFELDTLVAKMLTADNAVIKQTLEAGVVKVKGDITVTSGAISIENTESGTVFKVDRDGNVIANAVKITGGELNINDVFIVTNDGFLTAQRAEIRGLIEADSGLIANFIIESSSKEDGTGQYNRIYSGIEGTDDFVLISPGYSKIISSLDPSLKSWAFLAGNNNFGITTDGSLYAKNANVYGSIHITSGDININDKFIAYSDGSVIASAISITGGSIEIKDSSYNINFQVTDQGILTAKSAVLESVTINGGSIEIKDSSDNTNFKVTNQGELTAKLGNIAGFTITSTSIYNGISAFDQDTNVDGVYIGNDGLRIGKNLKIYPDGRIMSGSRNYNSALIYNKGDYCIYQGNLYKCKFDNTTGTWDNSKWDLVSYASFGLDDTGKFTATSATIIGNITAESGYIGNSESGFEINSDSISKYISDTESIYIGTDAIRLGQNIRVTDQHNIGNFTLNSYVWNNSISNEYYKYEYILSYTPVNYDRYISIREQEILGIDNDTTDYIHFRYPGFIPIKGVAYINNEYYDTFDIDSEGKYISIDNTLLWNDRDEFIPCNIVLKYTNNSGHVLDCTIYHLNRVEWDQVTSGQSITLPEDRKESLFISEDVTKIKITRAIINYPWMYIKVSYNGQNATIENCSVEIEQIKVVKLPARSSEIGISFKKYNNLKIRWEYNDGDNVDDPIISNINLSLKTLPGFIVTNDGFLTAYNAKIYGSFIGDLNIIGGSISIAGSNEALKNKISSGDISDDNIKSMCSILDIEYISKSDAEIKINNRIPNTGTNSNITGGQLAQIYELADLTYNSTVFKVDEDGKLTATAATIEGDIKVTSGSISINDDQFKVDSDGNVTIKSGSIKIGSGFEVKTSGQLICIGASVTGNITTGNLQATGGTIGGLTINSDGFSLGQPGDFNTVRISTSGYLSLNRHTVMDDYNTRFEASYIQIYNRSIDTYNVPYRIMYTGILVNVDTSDSDPEMTYCYRVGTVDVPGNDFSDILVSDKFWDNGLICFVSEKNEYHSGTSAHQPEVFWTIVWHDSQTYIRISNDNNRSITASYLIFGKPKKNY